MAKIRCWLCLAALMVAGCPSLPTRQDLQEAGLIPSKTEPWCLPHGKYQRDDKRVVLGVKCAW